MRCWLRLLRYSQLCHHTLNPTPCYILEILIITSLILSTLYIGSIFHIFKKRSKNILPNITVFFLSSVDDSLFISQKKSYKKSNAYLFCSYNIISTPFNWFRLIIEHGKLEVFHFSRSTRNFNLPSLNLSLLEGPILWPKDTWRYLGFIFNRKLSFQHIHFYSNKALLTIKSMRILGNFTSGLLSYHK